MLSKKECLKILLLAGASEKVIEHCKTVSRLAVKIASYTNADLSLVEVGALLHDLGRTKTHGIAHGVEGAKLARSLGLDEKICLIIERHLGAGIPKEDAKRHGLPEKDFIPRSLEEKIVAHADNLISHNKKQKLELVFKSYLKIGRKDIAERIAKLHKELSELCGKDIDEL